MKNPNKNNTKDETIDIPEYNLSSILKDLDDDIKGINLFIKQMYNDRVSNIKTKIAQQAANLWENKYRYPNKNGTPYKTRKDICLYIFRRLEHKEKTRNKNKNWSFDQFYSFIKQL